MCHADVVQNGLVSAKTVIVAQESDDLSLPLGCQQLVAPDGIRERSGDDKA